MSSRRRQADTTTADSNNGRPRPVCKHTITRASRITASGASSGPCPAKHSESCSPSLPPVSETAPCASVRVRYGCAVQRCNEAQGPV